jgi:hypothetical protein
VTPISAAENQGDEMTFGDRRLYVDSGRPRCAKMQSSATAWPMGQIDLQQLFVVHDDIRYS